MKDWTSDTGQEMRSKGRIYLASMGIYIFNRQFLTELLKMEKKDATDFGKEIIPDSIEKYKVVSYQYDGYWTDIGNIYSFFESNLGLTQTFRSLIFLTMTMRFTPAPECSAGKNQRNHVGKNIGCRRIIINASRIEHSVIGIRCRIGHGTLLVSSYLMGNDYYETIDEINNAQKTGIPLLGIGHRCYINNAIVDKNCRIGDDVRINGGPHLENTDHSLYTIKDGIVVVKKGAVIPNGFVI